MGWYDYGFRWYDPEKARFVSVDPLGEKFVYLTPYQYASNTPIQAIDLDGAEAWFHQLMTKENAQKTSATLGITSVEGKKAVEFTFGLMKSLSVNGEDAVKDIVSGTLNRAGRE
ncbi:MAG: RHS repeat-associated core domain-containing protein [Bacteroidia bacterium]